MGFIGSRAFKVDRVCRAFRVLRAFRLYRVCRALRVFRAFSFFFFFFGGGGGAVRASGMAVEGSRIWGLMMAPGLGLGL